MIDINKLLIYESTFLELKGDRPEKSSTYLKTIVAFSNATQLSYMVFGIDDKKKNPTGIDIETLQKRVMQEIENQVIPRVIPTYEIQQYKGKEILVVQIKPGLQTPYRLKSNHKVYVRNGESSIEATASEINDLVLRGKNVTLDQLPTQYKIDDIRFDLYKEKYYEFHSKNFEPPHYSKLNMTEGDYINFASLLVSDDNNVESSKLTFALFKGKNRIDIIDKTILDGSVIDQIDTAMNLVKKYSKKVIATKNLKRDELDEYHFEAIREAMVNAFVHRDYNLTYSNNTVYMFEDRIEISSVGNPPSPIENIKSLIDNPSSIRRNPVLCRLFDEIGYMEQMGRGISNIIEIYQNAYMKPEFEQKNDMVTVTFYSLSYYQDRETRIVNYIKEHNFITTKEVMEMTNVTDSAARKILRKMQNEKMIMKESDSKPAKYVIVNK